MSFTINQIQKVAATSPSCTIADSLLADDGTTASLSGPLVSTPNGAASLPISRWGGTWYSGGTGTTTKPALLLEPTGTASTAWNTAGTGLGINAASGFTGNLIDAQVAGASQFSVSAVGAVVGASFSGVAATATKLATARAINGVNFDGTAAITVAAAAGTLTGGTLASGVTISSLVQVGTITTGVWNGTVIGTAYIGTGSPTAGYYVDGGTGAWTVLPSGGTGANPTGTIGLSAVNGSASTFLRSDGAPALSQAIVPTWTGLHTFGKTIAANTAQDAILLAAGGTASASGTQYYSGSLHMQCSAYKTNATAAAQSNDMIQYLTPVSGAASTSSVLNWAFATNGGAYSTPAMTLASANGGALTVGGIIQLASFNNTANAGLCALGNANSVALTSATGGYVIISTGGAYLQNSGGLCSVGASLGGNIGGAQFGVLSSSATIIAGIYKNTSASRSVQLIQLQTSAGGAIGTVGGRIFNSFTDGASSSTNGTFDTLYTYTTVANQLQINGDTIQGRFFISIVGSATATREVKLAFAGIGIFDSGSLTVGTTSGIFVVDYVIIRVTSTTCRAMVEMRSYGSTTLLGDDLCQYTSDATLTGLTLTGTNVLLLTGAAAGTGASAGDITARIGIVDGGQAA
jgi:hypothetical protein